MSKWMTPFLALFLTLTHVTPVHALAFPGSIKKLSVPSPEKDFPVRDVYVWTPPTEDSNTANLPVVYMLHGWPGTPSGLMTGTINALAQSFTNGAKPFIAVFPDGNAKTHIDSEWADSYDGKAKIETWLTKNVIQTVEGDNLRSRDNRAILGFSMGGYGAAIIGLHHPELYSQVVTLAGYFVIDDLTNAFGNKLSKNNKIAFQTPLNHLKNSAKLNWFLGESPEDLTLLIHGQADSWGKRLKAQKANYVVVKKPGGHSYSFVSNEMESVAKWLTWSL